MVFRRNADGTITVALGRLRKAVNDPKFGLRLVQ